MINKKGLIIILTAKLGKETINCFDERYNKETLKKWANKNIILCPVCGKPYEYCHGKVISPYFRHKDKQECDIRFSEPETEEHIKGKTILYKWLQGTDGVTDLILEGWLQETHQRPDVMFKFNNEQYVIEFQCSPISSEYLERHELYQTAGIHDIWILGTEKYNLDFKGRTRSKTIELYTDIYLDVNKKKFNIDKNEIVNKLHNYSDYNLSHMWVKLNSIELNGKIFKFEICDEYIAPYLEIEYQKQLEKEKQEKQLSICVNSIPHYINELNLIYSKVKYHCRFKYYDRNEKSPYYVKITCTSEIFDELVFFIKDETIDVCEPYGYKKPWYAYSSKKHCNTIHGWNSCVGYRKIECLQFDINHIEIIKKVIWDYIRDKLQNYYQNKVKKY